jgi:hypothetical protein
VSVRVEIEILFAHASKALRAAGLESQARVVERLNPDPGAKSCALSSLQRVEMTVLLAWGAELMPRDSPVAKALGMVSVARAAFVVAATDTRQGPRLVLDLLGWISRV